MVIRDPGTLKGVPPECRPNRAKPVNFRVSSCHTLWGQDTASPSPRCPGRQKESLIANCLAILCGGLQDPLANMRDWYPRSWGAPGRNKPY